MSIWQRFVATLFAGTPPVPPVMAYVQSGEWRNVQVEVEAVSWPSGERQVFQVFFLEGTCLLPWLPDAEQVTWILRDGSRREARVRRSLKEASEGGAAELVFVSRPPLD